MKLSKKALICVVLVASLVGVVLGAVLTQWQLEISVKITGAELLMMKPDHTTKLYTVDFGSVTGGTIKRMPELETESYYLKNLGETKCYLYCSTNEFTEGTLELYDFTAKTKIADGTLLNAGAEIRCYLLMTINSGAVRSTYAITFTIEGRDA